MTICCQVATPTACLKLATNVSQLIIVVGRSVETEMLTQGRFAITNNLDAVLTVSPKMTCMSVSP